MSHNAYQNAHFLQSRLKGYAAPDAPKWENPSILPLGRVRVPSDRPYASIVTPSQVIAMPWSHGPAIMVRYTAVHSPEGCGISADVDVTLQWRGRPFLVLIVVVRSSMNDIQ